MKVIAYKNLEGFTTICVPVNDIQYVIENDIPGNCEYIEIDFENLPHEHEDFFNAWQIENNNIVINMNKAKEITKTRLRMEREPLFLEQDILFQKKQELGLDTSEIVTEKNRLRNITNLVDTCDTLQELRSLKVQSSTLITNSILLNIPTSE